MSGVKAFATENKQQYKDIRSLVVQQFMILIRCMEVYTLVKNKTELQLIIAHPPSIPVCLPSLSTKINV